MAASSRVHSLQRLPLTPPYSLLLPLTPSYSLLLLPTSSYFLAAHGQAEIYIQDIHLLVLINWFFAHRCFSHWFVTSPRGVCCSEVSTCWGATNTHVHARSTSSVSFTRGYFEYYLRLIKKKLSCQLSLLLLLPTFLAIGVLFFCFRFYFLVSDQKVHQWLKVNGKA